MIARWLHPLFALALAAALLLPVGCARRELPTEYGKRRPTAAGHSVSGTAALAKLFESQGAKIRGASKLSDRLEQVQTIVWTPDSFKGPSLNERLWLERWLHNQGAGGRTLIYIGRDFDPAERYWELIAETSKPPESFERKRRWADVKSKNEAARAQIPTRQPYGWFDQLGSIGERKIDSLDGPWAEGIDPAKADLWLNTRLDLPTDNVAPVIPPPVITFPWKTKPKKKAKEEPPTVQLGTGESEILLQSENDILAFRQMWRDVPNSQLIVVANGSFALNLPLANNEHRKLAMRLVKLCPANGAVAFLESGEGGVSISKGEEAENAIAWRMMTTWPLGVIVIHFAALGLAYIVSRFLQFGRPKKLPAESQSDFGKHVDALGKMLARTRDHAFATNNLQQYRVKSRRASGIRHDSPGTMTTADALAEKAKAAAQPAATIELRIPQPIPPSETASPSPVDPPSTSLSSSTSPSSGPSVN